MTNGKSKFRKKPIIVEAEQVLSEKTIHTLEGDMKANVGDWIVTGINGEKYPVKPDIFEKTFEPVSKETTNETLIRSTTQKIIDILPNWNWTNRVNEIEKIILEALEENEKEIFKKEPDELIENARLKADLAMAYAEREELQNQLKESMQRQITNFKDVMLAEERVKHFKEIENMEKKLKEQLQSKIDKRIAELEEKIKKYYSGEGVSDYNVIGELSLFIEELEKLKEAI